MVLQIRPTGIMIYFIGLFDNVRGYTALGLHHAHEAFGIVAYLKHNKVCIFIFKRLHRVSKTSQRCPTFGLL